MTVGSVAMPPWAMPIRDSTPSATVGSGTSSIEVCMMPPWLDCWTLIVWSEALG